MKTNEMSIENEMSPEKSLKLISQMLDENRKDFEDRSGRPLLIWGIVVMAVSAVIWLLVEKTGNLNWNFLWFAVPVLGYVFCWLLIPKRPKTRSFVNDTIYWVWTIFGIIAIGITVVSLLLQIFGVDAVLNLSFCQCILVSMGCCTAITGVVVKNNLVLVCGLLTAVCGAVCAAIFPDAYGLLIILGAFLSLVVPAICFLVKSK